MDTIETAQNTCPTQKCNLSSKFDNLTKFWGKDLFGNWFIFQ